VVADEVRNWQTRPVDDVYPIVYVDALRIKIRDNGSVVNRAAHLVVGVDGFKHILGVRIQDTEGAKFWPWVLTDPRRRGPRDVLILCCDGLTVQPDEIAATRPDAVTHRADSARNHRSPPALTYSIVGAGTRRATAPRYFRRAATHDRCATPHR
jgi:transposase-like protein